MNRRGGSEAVFVIAVLEIAESITSTITRATTTNELAG